MDDTTLGLLVSEVFDEATKFGRSESVAVAEAYGMGVVAERHALSRPQLMALGSAVYAELKREAQNRQGRELVQSAIRNTN